MWFFLAIVQQDGGVGMTFGTSDECIETRGTMSNDPRVMFLSDCMSITLTPMTFPKDNRTGVLQING